MIAAELRDYSPDIRHVKHEINEINEIIFKYQTIVMERRNVQYQLAPVVTNNGP